MFQSCNCFYPIHSRKNIRHFVGQGRHCPSSTFSERRAKWFTFENVVFACQLLFKKSKEKRLTSSFVYPEILFRKGLEDIVETGRGSTKHVTEKKTWWPNRLNILCISFFFFIVFGGYHRIFRRIKLVALKGHRVFLFVVVVALRDDNDPLTIILFGLSSSSLMGVGRHYHDSLNRN